MKSLLTITCILALTISAVGQGKPDRVKNHKDVAASHKTLVLLPIQFKEKEYDSYPEGITAEIIAEGEREKGLKFQELLYAEFSKKQHKYDHSWVDIKEVNEKLTSSGYDLMKLNVEQTNELAKLFGADAVVFSQVETTKVILPESKGSEMEWDSSHIYGFTGSDTYINMSIHEKESSEPYWKWRIKFNGKFSKPELMINIIEKNYLNDDFPYKY